MLLEMVRAQLGRHKLRTALTILGIVIGIMLITTMAAFTTGINNSLEEGMDMLAGKVTVAEEGATFQSFIYGELDESVVDDIEGMAGVKKVAPFVVVITPEGWVSGFDSDALEFFGLEVGFEAGGMFEDGTNEAVLGTLYAQYGGYALGDLIEIRNRQYEVVGIAETFGNPQDDNSVLLPLEAAQELNEKGDIVTAIMLEPYVIKDAESIAKEIEDNYDDLDALTDKELLSEMEELLGQVNMMIYAIGSIAAIIAAIVIMNVMFMSVSERTREIGAMKALGATDYQVLTEILGESIILAMIGGTIGLALSWGATYAINAILAYEYALIDTSLAINSLLFSLVLGVVGGVLPARRAAKLDPIVALRYE